jgi:hypothetical protein
MGDAVWGWASFRAPRRRASSWVPSAPFEASGERLVLQFSRRVCIFDILARCNEGTESKCTMAAGETAQHYDDTIIEIGRQGTLQALSHEVADRPAEEKVETSGFKIRLANTEGRRSKASYLIKRQFAWRGYQVGSLAEVPANRITLAAFSKDELPVATITVGVDSPAGLSVESVYPEEVQALRATGRRLGEFTRLAVDSMVKSRSVLAAIFHIAYIYAYRIRDCTDLVIEVNPRHVRFYEAMLGFIRCGEQRVDPRVNAPAVLLRLELGHAEAEIARYGGHAELANDLRVLYPLFFSPAEEQGIEGRLRSR